MIGEDVVEVYRLELHYLVELFRLDAHLTVQVLLDVLVH
jgi:hypothetical protein